MPLLLTLPLCYACAAGPPPSLPVQTMGKFLKQILTILSTILTMLFKLHNIVTNKPVASC